MNWLRAVVRLLRGPWDPEPYSPEFAGHCDDALDCGCVSGVQFFCLYCQRSACERHRDDIHDCGIARSVPFVDSNHPTDCDEECCFEIRLTEKTDAFPWDAYEQELTS